MSIAKSASALIICSALFATMPVYAAGGGTETTVPTCKKGKIWDKKKKKCLKIKKSSSLDDDNLFLAARDLAYNHRYEEAIEVLHLAKNQNDPRILNYLGFATRKLGDVEKGLTYYAAALKIDPNYTLVREYMGEAFLQLGQINKAQEQLAEIGKRCGLGCREYAMLKAEIGRFTQ
ncbi:MAG: hypothetical protein COC23_00070 [Hyphomicrobiales bacterium]|nr:MAG: hypothetical protein COC23_00070 [Hyphomicrobiales bacterium]